MFNLKELKTKERNPRKVRDEKIEQLKKSITDFPKMLALRPIVYDPNTMEVIGGNQRLTALIQLGHKSVPNEWVKSADDLNEEEKKRFLIQDNVQVGDWDTEILNEDFDSDVLAEWGVDIPSFEDIEAAENDNEEVGSGEESKYNQSVEAPIYEPKNEKPKLFDVYDSVKFKQLIEQIESSAATKDEKEFLRLAATRHIVFNYEKIADLYAHSGKDMQEQMENSALVIIDFKKAIELGYVRLCEDIRNQYLEEYGE